MTRHTPTPDSVRLRLAGLCARSEQCEYDLRRKIARAGLTAEDSDDIIGFLRRERFIDDLRFARAFARDKARFSGWGPAKIRAQLSARRIPPSVIAEALEATDTSDLHESLIKAAKAKARNLDLSSRQDQAKLCRHLIGRGFSYSDFRKAVAKLQEDAAEESD